MFLTFGLLAIVLLVYVLYKYGGYGSVGTSQAEKKWVDPDELFNIQKMEKRKEMDRILEKIEKKGMSSLSEKERDFLNGF